MSVPTHESRRRDSLRKKRADHACGTKGLHFVRAELFGVVNNRIKHKGESSRSSTRSCNVLLPSGLTLEVGQLFSLFNSLNSLDCFAIGSKNATQRQCLCPTTY